jgi:protein TonB
MSGIPPDVESFNGKEHMFEQTFVDGSGKTKKPWTVASAFLMEIIAVIVIIVIPLIFTDVLPKAMLTSVLEAPAAPEPPKPPPPPPPDMPKVKVPPKMFDMDKLMAPTRVPKRVAEIVDDPNVELPTMSQVQGAVPGSGGPPTGLSNLMKAPPPPPPPPKAVEKPPTPTRIRVGGNVAAASLIRKVQPVYPQLAKQARVQGSVHFTAIIGKDGTIQNLQLIGGHPLLVQAAQDAVKQWLYKPTLLNGEPVEVVTQIDVNFTLSQ